MVFDNGKVVYAESEKSPGEVSVRYAQSNGVRSTCANEDSFRFPVPTPFLQSCEGVD
jgi:hypothetical protein